MVRRVGPTGGAFGFHNGHSNAGWLPLQFTHWCVKRHPGKEHLFRFQLRQVSPERSRSRDLVGPAKVGRVRATTADSIAFRLLATSGSASDVRLQSSALCVALRQRSHLSDLFALPVKHIAHSDGLIRDQSVCPRTAAWRLYATSYAARPFIFLTGPHDRNHVGHELGHLQGGLGAQHTDVNGKAL